MKYEICKLSKSAGVFYAVAWTDVRKYAVEIAKSILAFSRCAVAVRDAENGCILETFQN